VLRGDMSLVGPRPALPEEVAEYAEWHRQRLATAPGMTGLWQVSGRSELPFDEMVLLDIYYIENWTPFTDLSILLRTVPRVLSGSGAY
ncbi:MAG: sugar transferase, partial [Anaerolineae bacterium]|nr:sugar transferase [Anaerolineae bacterium]